MPVSEAPSTFENKERFQQAFNESLERYGFDFIRQHKGIAYFAIGDDIAHNTSINLLTNEYKEKAVVFNTLLSAINLSYEVELLENDAYINMLVSTIKTFYETANRLTNFPLLMTLYRCLISYDGIKEVLEGLLDVPEFSNYVKDVIEFGGYKAFRMHMEYLSAVRVEWEPLEMLTRDF